MREIKFRAWDATAEYMNYNVQFTGHLNQLFTERPTIHYTQYTDLKDKNGKEIYDKDIVEWQGFKKPVDYSTELGCWMFGGLNFNGAMARRCEVIGNIYENPELLK